MPCFLPLFRSSWATKNFLSHNGPRAIAAGVKVDEGIRIALLGMWVLALPAHRILTTSSSASMTASTPEDGYRESGGPGDDADEI